MTPSSRHHQSGNMLIYILGAIILLGILIIASKGNFQPGTGIDAEKVALQVTNVRRYAAELERGVTFGIRNGISESDIRFSHPSADVAYGTYGTNPKAEIFNPAGGGVEWKNPPTGVQVTTTPWSFFGVNEVHGVGTTCGALECSDLIAMLPYVTREFCININNSVGVNNPAGVPPKEDSSFRTDQKFTVGFGYSTALRTVGDHTAGRPEGCFEGNTASAATALTGQYYYYKVLMAR